MAGRVAVLKAYGGDFELREYPVPDPGPAAHAMCGPVAPSMTD